MTIGEDALDLLADIGFDPVYGARPLKRAIQKELETSVAQGILRGDYVEGDNILVGAEDGKLVVTTTVNAVVEPVL